MGNDNSTSRAQGPQFIADRFESLEQVQAALREAGLESSNLILAIDLTASNERSGTYSFKGQSLHSTRTIEGVNPYQSVMSIICKTVAAFDDDNLIPTFGFGDRTSEDHSLLSFDPQGRPIHSLDNVLAAYSRIIDKVELYGPTSFAPAIYKAIDIVRESKGGYHILVIIADGQVTGGDCLQKTDMAIKEASNYALSIVVVGVGDGPWNSMKRFDDMPGRRFDNFQFVNYTEISNRAKAQRYTPDKWEADFALNALMEIPDQYAAICDLGLLSKDDYKRPLQRVPVLLPSMLT